MADGGQHTQPGWEISDVERLIGLPRRYIQRACYAGKDGAGILSPDTNGRERSYGVSDLATLFIVALYRDERYSPDRRRHTLGEVRNLMEERHWNVEEMLASEAELLRDELEEVAGQYLRARALEAALSEKPEEGLAALLHEAEGASDALFGRAGTLGTPGLALARELLAGYTGLDDKEDET